MQIINVMFEHLAIRRDEWSACTINVIMKFFTQCPYVQIWVRVSNGFRNGRSTETGMDRTTAIGTCRECWCIPENGTYVHIKSNELAYKGEK